MRARRCISSSGHWPALRSERSLGSLSGAAEFSCRAPGNIYPSDYRPRGLALKRHVLHQPKFTTYGSDTAGCRLDALGDDLDELLSYLDAWSEAIVDANSYPTRISGIYYLGGGPHVSGLTIDIAADLYEGRA